MQLNSVKVVFENTTYNYQTSVSCTATKESATHYFVGQKFNLGAYPVENMQVCTGIEFINNNTLKSVECSKVLQLMDEDFGYQKALNTVLGMYEEVNKAELETELNNYI